MNFEEFKDNFANIIEGVLNLTPKTLIGLDIGLSSVKVLQLSHDKNGSKKIEHFGLYELPEGCLIEDEIVRPAEILKAIKEVLAHAGIKQKNVSIALFGQNTIIKRMQVGGGTQDEIEEQAIWEAEQYIPFGVDNSVVSVHVFGENLGGGADVLMAAASMDLVEANTELIKELHLRARVIDLNVLALANVFEYLLGKDLEKSEGNYIFLDFGAQSTKLVVYNGELILGREIPISGLIITEEIQRQMGLNFLEAEDLKTTRDENGNPPAEILEIISTVLESFFGEIKRNIDLILQSYDSGFAKVYVTGGTSLTPGLIDGLKGLFQVEVEQMVLTNRIEVDEKAIGEEELELLNTRGLIALGLALRRPAND